MLCVLCHGVQVPSFTITKLLWLKRHEPDVWSQVASVLLPHDYMNFWLTGRKVTEVRKSGAAAAPCVQERFLCSSHLCAGLGTHAQDWAHVCGGHLCA
jgi:sugar (pentulose or hexulose) kinase